jgi:hypothetical protein
MILTGNKINNISINLIDELDFSMLKLKLMDKEEGENWTYQMCENAEWKYKMFLKLIYLYPNESIVPDLEIDKFWHYHILDTRDYISVTSKIFGKYIHHNPYFGFNGEDSRIELNKCFQKTQNLFKKHFGFSVSNLNSDCGNDNSSTCISSCRH